MITGAAIDIVDVEKIRAAVGRRHERLLRKLYTQEELKYCYRAKDPFPRLAARFAAKEAVLKAFGLGWADGVKWTEVEVLPGKRRNPVVVLHGSAKRKARERGILKVMLSMSHTGRYAIATVSLAG